MQVKANKPLISSFAGVKHFPGHMWPHQYFIWSLIDGTYRQSLYKRQSPATVVKKAFKDESLEGHLPWDFFFRHVCSADARFGVGALSYDQIRSPEQRNCLQWCGCPAPETEENDVPDDFGTESEDED